MFCQQVWNQRFIFKVQNKSPQKFLISWCATFPLALSITLQLILHMQNIEIEEVVWVQNPDPLDS